MTTAYDPGPESTNGHYNGRLMAIMAYAYGGAEALWALACDAGDCWAVESSNAACRLVGTLAVVDPVLRRYEADQ